MAATHFQSGFGFIVSCLIASGIFTNSILGQTVSYGTGTFSVSCAATITATPVSFIQGAVLDTSFVYRTGTNNQVAFNLPVRITTKTVKSFSSRDDAARLVLKIDKSGNCLMTLPSGFFRARIDVADLFGHCVFSGRADADGRVQVDFSQCADGVFLLRIAGTQASLMARMAFSGKTAQVQTLHTAGMARPTGQKKSAATTAVYRIKLTSNSTSFRDTDNVLITLIEGANGTKSFTLASRSASASETFKELVTEANYNVLFPNRYGLGKASPASDGKYDFYTYASLLKAIDQIANIAVKIVRRRGVDYVQKVVWRDKTTGVTRSMITGSDYNASWNVGLPEDTVATVDYAKFCAEGTLTIRKRELAAFFANISHETTGMGEGDATKTWGLYWIEEMAWQLNPNNTTLGYVDYSNTVYPPVAGKSYHGRGPIQISYNYNYGQVSEFLYGDKNILLQDPGKVLSGGDVAFMTALWFWMTPQSPKPSCHDIMCENWQPNSADIAAKRNASRFGNTVNVINGNLECNNGNPNDSRVKDRIGFYKRYATVFAITTETECGCYMMAPY